MSVDSQSDIINGFTFKLFEYLSSGRDANFFISPFSIATALSMVLSGAKNETLDQLKILLNISSLSTEQIHEFQQNYLSYLTNFATDKSVVLNLANKIYSKNGYQLKQDYINALIKYYSSEIESIDFSKSEQSAKKINKWIANKTNNKITNLITSDGLSELTRLVLLNAIYFKGKWLNKFDKGQTNEDTFKIRNGSIIKVDMMQLRFETSLYKLNPSGLTACTCELPYVGNSVSMVIILPNEGINIEDVEKQLNHETLKSIFKRNINSFNRKVHLYLPKFKMDIKTELTEPLKNLGARIAFDSSKADFSGIAEDADGFYISNVIHQAVVEVNEEGTEAAAVTVITADGCCMNGDSEIPQVFKCNRPFLFIIKENKFNSILFFGKLSFPLAN